MTLNLPNKDIGCHRCMFEKKCFDLVTTGICNRWIEISGTNPNTGEAVNHYDCVDNWGPLLTIEGSGQIRQMAAAIESLRNELKAVMVEQNMIELGKLKMSQLYLANKGGKHEKD